MFFLTFMWLKTYFMKKLNSIKGISGLRRDQLRKISGRGAKECITSADCPVIIACGAPVNGLCLRNVCIYPISC